MATVTSALNAPRNALRVHVRKCGPRMVMRSPRGARLCSSPGGGPPGPFRGGRGWDDMDMDIPGFFSKIERFADYMDDMDRDIFRPEGMGGGKKGMMRIAMDIREEDDKYTVMADLPGLTKDDVNVRITDDNVLEISGKREAEEKREGEGWYRVERRFGRFSRTYRLPKNADARNISAKVENGVLHVSVPKLEEKDVGTRTIEIE